MLSKSRNSEFISKCVIHRLIWTNEDLLNHVLFSDSKGIKMRSLPRHMVPERPLPAWQWADSRGWLFVFPLACVRSTGEHKNNNIIYMTIRQPKKNLLPNTSCNILYLSTKTLRKFPSLFQKRLSETALRRMAPGVPKPLRALQWMTATLDSSAFSHAWIPRCQGRSRRKRTTFLVNFISMNIWWNFHFLVKYFLFWWNVLSIFMISSWKYFFGVSIFVCNIANSI